MKRIGICILIAACLPILVLSAKAAPDDELRSFAETDSIWEAIPEEVDRDELTSFFREDSPQGSLAIVGKKLISMLTLSAKDSLALFSSLLILLMLSALFNAVAKHFTTGMDDAFDLLFLLAAALIICSFLENTLSSVTLQMQSVNAFMMACIPVSATLLTLSGAARAGAVQTASLTFGISFVSFLLTHVIYPTVRMLFALAFLEGSSFQGLKGLIGFFQKTVKRLCVLLFTVISATLALKNTLASAADSVAMRSVRFAAGNFIPVVGSLVGENSKVLSASFQLVKTECGVVALFVVLSLLLQPILTVSLQKIVLNLASSVGEMLGEERCRRYFTAVSRVLDLMLALMISHGCYLIFTVTLFLKAKGGV